MRFASLDNSKGGCGACYRDRGLNRGPRSSSINQPTVHKCIGILIRFFDFKLTEAVTHSALGMMVFPRERSVLPSFGADLQNMAFTATRTVNGHNFRYRLLVCALCTEIFRFNILGFSSVVWPPRCSRCNAETFSRRHPVVFLQLPTFVVDSLSTCEQYVR